MADGGAAFVHTARRSRSELAKGIGEKRQEGGDRYLGRLHPKISGTAAGGTQELARASWCCCCGGGFFCVRRAPPTVKAEIQMSSQVQVNCW